MFITVAGIIMIINIIIVLRIITSISRTRISSKKPLALAADALKGPVGLETGGSELGLWV